jgi:uncharacterized membrane protein YphA (DoxX/SURF4 family)
MKWLDGVALRKVLSRLKGAGEVSMLTVGMRVYALGAIALGLIGLVWGDFALVWQPVPADFPARTLLAYLFSAALLLGGLALCWRPSAARGAAALAVLFTLVVLLMHIPRVLRHPAVFGVYSGVAEQLALATGGYLAYLLCTSAAGRPAPDKLRIGLWAYGICLLLFGGAHFFYLPDTAAMVPHWLPPGQMFWAWATGCAHVAAGLAILSGVQARLAAVMATIMFASFSVLVHIPLLLGDLHSHLNWVMNAMNLSLTGSAWVLADALGRAQRS